RYNTRYPSHVSPLIHQAHCWRCCCSFISDQNSKVQRPISHSHSCSLGSGDPGTVERRGAELHQGARTTYLAEDARSTRDQVHSSTNIGCSSARQCGVLHRVLTIKRTGLRVLDILFSLYSCQSLKYLTFILILCCRNSNIN